MKKAILLFTVILIVNFTVVSQEKPLTYIYWTDYSENGQIPHKASLRTSTDVGVSLFTYSENSNELKNSPHIIFVDYEKFILELKLIKLKILARDKSKYEPTIFNASVFWNTANGEKFDVFGKLLCGYYWINDHPVINIVVLASISEKSEEKIILRKMYFDDDIQIYSLLKSFGVEFDLK